MRMTHVAVAAIGLTAGGCSLRSPGGTGAYSALQPEAAIPAASAPLPSGFAEAPVQGVMPGDLKSSAAKPSGGGVDPVAALNASARARSHWETLRPGDLTHTSSLAYQVPASTGSGAATSAATSAAMAPPTAPAAAPRNGANPDARTYDREAAMQGLINGGRSAGKGICSGC